MKLVRIKPKPKNSKSHRLRSYTHLGQRYRIDDGWYQVDDSVAEYLAKVRHISEDPESPLAFDVCEPTQAAEISAKELDTAAALRPENAPIVAVTAAIEEKPRVFQPRHR